MATRTVAVAILLALLPAAGGGAAEEVAFREVLEVHLSRYPEMEVEDLYKLAFQAALGSEHAVPDPSAARSWLEREAALLTPDDSEPPTEPLSPDGRLVRLHLRPYLAGGGDLEPLARAFVATAERFEGSKARLRRYWTCAVGMAREGAVPFEPAELERFFERMAARNHPAVHHSATYRSLYRPAYRVILLELLEQSRGAGAPR